MDMETVKGAIKQVVKNTGANFLTLMAALSRTLRSLPGRIRLPKTVPEPVKKFFSRVRKISADKALWIWAVVILGGGLLFKVINGNLLGTHTTLVFAQWWEDELDNQALVNLAAEFEAQNPGITVKLEKMTWPEIRALFETAEDTKKKRPDIFSVDPYAVSGLETYIQPEDPLAGGVQPVVSFINVLFYNIDLFKAAGFDRPPKNQTEFLSYVQRIGQESGGVYGAGLALEDNSPHSVNRHFLSWIWSALGNPEAESFNFNSRQVISVLNFLNQLKRNLYADPFSVTEAELTTAFSEGKVGMMIGSVANIRELKTTMANAFGVTTIPGIESYVRKPVFPLTVWYASVNQQSEHREEARNFLSFLKEKDGIIAAEAYAVPGNGRRNPDLSKGDPLYAKAFDMYEAGEIVRELYGSKEAAELNSLILRQIRLMFLEALTPEQCAEAIQLGWEKIAGPTDPRQD
ncbi:MAG: extracellular solute-binding protein [Spirochaetaceae bacterium]|jgi:multiple sugar transport system substrate-binding protein|nr:extracellular solute-binding protein [Spirochaetaceae bacterium]